MAERAKKCLFSPDFCISWRLVAPWGRGPRAPHVAVRYRLTRFLCPHTGPFAAPKRATGYQRVISGVRAGGDITMPKDAVLSAKARERWSDDGYRTRMRAAISAGMMGADLTRRTTPGTGAPIEDMRRRKRKGGAALNWAQPIDEAVNRGVYRPGIDPRPVFVRGRRIA